MRLQGATVLLTGATGGLGHAIARRLAADGAELVLTGRRADALATLAGELGARTIEADLAEPAASAHLLEEAGPVDVVVANAALPASGHVMDFDVERIERSLRVNLYAPLALARLALPSMLERGGGHVTFVSSLAGVAATNGSSVYSASKAGLRAFALGARQDLHGTGVGLSVITPGFIRDAGMFADSNATLPPGVGTASPEQVAAAVATSITADRAEIVVAPSTLHVLAKVGAAFPRLAEVVTRRTGGVATAERIAAGQQDKR